MLAQEEAGPVEQHIIGDKLGAGEVGEHGDALRGERLLADRHLAVILARQNQFDICVLRPRSSLSSFWLRPIVESLELLDAEQEARGPAWHDLGLASELEMGGLRRSDIGDVGVALHPVVPGEHLLGGVAGERHRDRARACATVVASSSATRCSRSAQQSPPRSAALATPLGSRLTRSAAQQIRQTRAGTARIIVFARKSPVPVLFETNWPRRLCAGASSRAKVPLAS